MTSLVKFDILYIKMFEAKNLKINNSVELEFYKNYAENVAPILEEFEKERQKKFLIFTLAAVPLILLTIAAWIAGNAYMEIRVFGVVFFPVLLVILAYYMNKKFCDKLKNSCMPKIVRNFENLKWKCCSTPNIDDSLFGNYDTRYEDDYFEGKYKDVNFRVSETKLFYMSGGKKKYYLPCFWGIIISFLIHKPVRGKTIVTTKGDLNVRNNNPYMFALGVFFILGGVICVLAHEWIYCIVSFIFGFLFVKPNTDYKSTIKLRKITLEDPEFNKKYEACSSDEVEGRYLLTTAFMERFKNLHTVFGSRKAKCSFYGGNKIMFAIPTYKNLFEIGNLFFPINNIKKINTFLKEIQAVYDLIEYFKLDQRTGL